LNEQDKEIKLVEAAIAGDIESFGQLCRHYYSAMVGISYAIVRDHQLAEDAAQESFARAIVKINGLREKTKFAQWLAAICRNVSKDFVVKKIKEVSAERFYNASYTNDCIAGDQIIDRALDQLASSDKELIVLRYYDNLSYEQIGTVLGLTRAAVNGKLTRAKRKLSKHLKHSGFPENQL
jgi:RNA polymerase sigma-70 factor (ECF subfamily)